jgi:hypothetical protein
VTATLTILVLIGTIIEIYFNSPLKNQNKVNNDFKNNGPKANHIQIIEEINLENDVNDNIQSSVINKDSKKNSYVSLFIRLK